MKKTIFLSGMLCLLISTEATARVDLSVGLFAPPPVYYEPAPTYVEPPVYAGPPIYPSYAVEGGERWHRHGYDHGRRGHRGYDRERERDHEREHDRRR